MKQVLVRKLKYGGRLKSAWQGDLLPAPLEGWAVVLHHPRRHTKSQGDRRLPADRPFVHCLHTSWPLTVLLQYGNNGAFEGAKCDAALPAETRGDEIEFVDLDLDLVVARDLAPVLRDEDDFARNAGAMGYTAEVRGQARRGIETARRLLAKRLFPFDETVIYLGEAYR